MKNKKTKVLDFDHDAFMRDKSNIEVKIHIINEKIDILDDHGANYDNEDLIDLFTAGFQFPERFYSKQYKEVKIKRMKDFALEDLKKSIQNIIRFNAFVPGEHPELNYITFKNCKPVEVDKLDEILKMKHTKILKGQRAIEIYDKIEHITKEFNLLFDLMKPIPNRQWISLFQVKEDKIISNPDINYLQFNED
ncbi:hypothetical protein NMK71_00995 [Weeksellaceae bacterium KMM 9713]|uniref:Uncharacterized protein n=1 Tax=Profundicola chukchiensis TaxID=2961959 RepID=A0A9X4N1U5_9FLAO|nr:hypothetical protein [Profundicola chukchiensis]MDG4944979.1 hypothetical protein [Profundicola chukchiensis]